MSGLLSSLGFGSSAKPSNAMPIKKDGLFGFGSRKLPGYEDVKKQSIKDFRYKTKIEKDPRFSETNIRKIYGTEKVYKINQGKDRFSVKDAGKLLKKVFIQVGSTRENPNIEAAAEYLVKKEGFTREGAKDFITKFGRTIYTPPNSGPSKEVIAARIASIKALEGINSGMGNLLALNRQGKNSVKSIQNETSLRLNTLDTDAKVHGISALSQQKIDTDDIRRSGGINMSRGKTSINETEKAVGVVAGPQSATGITGGKVKTDNVKGGVKHIPLSKTA